MCTIILEQALRENEMVGSSNGSSDIVEDRVKATNPPLFPWVQLANSRNVWDMRNSPYQKTLIRVQKTSLIFRKSLGKPRKLREFVAIFIRVWNNQGKLMYLLPPQCSSVDHDGCLCVNSEGCTRYRP